MYPNYDKITSEREYIYYRGWDNQNLRGVFARRAFDLLKKGSNGCVRSMVSSRARPKLEEKSERSDQ